MMNVLYVCLAITLFQGIQGLESLDYQFVDGELEVSPHYFALMAAETQSLGGNEHCDNVSVTLQQMYKLGIEVAKWANKAFGVLAKDVNDFYHCSGLRVVQCSFQTFKKAKQDLLSLKPAFDEYKQQLAYLVEQLRKELPLCLH